MQKINIGVLIINLGTPSAPTSASVRKYLREFLSDPRVIELPQFLWRVLLNGVILPIRSAKSAKAYKTIWTDAGSPLAVYSQALTEKISTVVSASSPYPITAELAMRYGNPSIKSALQLFKNQISHLLVLPLFPQYSTATTASIFDCVTNELRHWRYLPDLRFVNSYAFEQDYIKTVSNQILDFWKMQQKGEKLLISFHGLPEASVKKGDPYFTQCQWTANQVANNLKLSPHEWQLTFQSRFGFNEWLKPYTEQSLITLAEQGLKTIDVICPGFAVDCLETLEEINMRYQENFIAAGGKTLRYIPALNATAAHTELLSSIIQKQIKIWSL